MASAFCFYLVLQRVLLFEAFGLVFCCSRLSGAVFQGQISRGPKDVFVDSKGNVKEFFGSGFGCFRLVSRWCLGLFASRAPRPERVLLFEAFGLVFCCSRLILRQFCSVFCCARLSGLCFAVRGFRKRWSKARFREAEKMFLWIPKVTWKSFLAPVLAVFGSCPDGVWDFSHLGLKARFREAQKIVVVDSKGNVKEFFGSGFGRFRLVS